jgi:serine/threonine-protein kinase
VNPRHAATATTRTASGGHRRPHAVLLHEGQLVYSVESGLSYRIGRMLGAGGFGQVFLATREGRSTTVPETLCVKVSTRMDGWLREAYFGQLLHRDLTPLNVFVCDAHRLKLGDFGIVRQQSDRRGVTARTLNPLMAPSDIFDGAAPKWQARDDVYQVGQLIGMLVRGDATRRVRTSEVRSLACSDQLKEIVYRCIGERRKRYQSADELIGALDLQPAPMRLGAVRSLKGVHLAFTGIFSVPRAEAVEAARRAGAIVHGGTSAKTTVVVRGRPNPLQAAGKDGGRKLMEIKRLREKGVRITLLSETQFWKLARPGTRRSRA